MDFFLTHNVSLKTCHSPASKCMPWCASAGVCHHRNFNHVSTGDCVKLSSLHSGSKAAYEVKSSLVDYKLFRKISCIT